MTDERKGGLLLLQALRNLRLERVVVLLIGNLDAPFEIPGVEIVSLGYVSDTATLVTAMNASDVYVGPSTEETFGQVFIEAALVGVASIGFNQSGVVDAIIDGVTGLRVECSPDALREAIARLYNDRELCCNLGQWARIYAANEFSLESSYRSLFNVWRSLGLVDKWQLPHKVGFIRQSRFLDATLGALSQWRAVDGISSVEGPYPASGVPTSFRWCHGSKVIVRINSPEAGPMAVHLSYYSNLFDEIEVAVRVNGEAADPVTIHRTDSDQTRSATIFLEARRGWNKLELMPDRILPPSGQEQRALTFMLKDIEMNAWNRAGIDELSAA
jgi:hypothetical protein